MKEGWEMLKESVLRYGLFCGKNDLQCAVDVENWRIEGVVLKEGILVEFESVWRCRSNVTWCWRLIEVVIEEFELIRRPGRVIDEGSEEWDWVWKEWRGV